MVFAADAGDCFKRVDASGIGRSRSPDDNKRDEPFFLVGSDRFPQLFGIHLKFGIDGKPADTAVRNADDAEPLCDGAVRLFGDIGNAKMQAFVV